MMYITEICDKETESVSDASSLELNDDITAETAEAVASWLVAKYRSKIIYDCIDDVFGELNNIDRQAVFESVLSIITGKYSIEHLEYIKKKIADFFEHDTKMNIDGFINFRLKAYKAELKLLVEECGFDFIAKKDYHDLIDVINFLFDVTDFELSDL